MHTQTGYRRHGIQGPGFARRSYAAPKSARIFSVAWFTCFLSLFMLALIARLGGAAAALFLFPWSILVIRAPQLALAKTIENSPLFLLPGLALLSTAWSQYPEMSLRASIQFLLTVEIAILAGSLTNPRTFVSALFSALTAIMIVSLVIDRGESLRGGPALMGVFQSKNQLAFYTVIQLISAITLVFDKQQPVMMRLIALFSLFVGPVCLVAAQSTGAIVFSIPAIAGLIAFITLGKFPAVTRATAITAALLAIIALIVAVGGFLDDFGAILDLLGKDSTLTGRLYLWQTARDLIGQSPILGVGYQAFWQVGNPPAEELWAASFEESGSGFNFHNLYLNTAVELGFLGLASLLLIFLATAIRLLRSIILIPSPPVYLAAAIFIIIFSTSFIEVNQLYQFHIGTVLFCVVWIYSGGRPLYPYGRVLTPAKRNALPL
ncbi:MAG: O-antigen ligase family protein [Rhodomicrobium sp.]